MVKANLKLCGVCFLSLVVFSAIGIFPENEEQLLYIMLGLICSILFAYFMNRTRLDVLSVSQLKELISEVISLGDGHRHTYRRDKFSTIKIILVYAFLIAIAGAIENEVTLFAQIMLAISGIIHAIFFSRLWGICPYCNYKVYKITRRTVSISCKVCQSRIIIHGNKLTRPLGRNA